MEDMNQQHAINMNSQKETYESIKTDLESNITNYSNSNRDLEAEVETFKRNEANMRFEHQEAIDTLQSCVDNQKESSRMLEG